MRLSSNIFLAFLRSETSDTVSISPPLVVLAGLPVLFADDPALAFPLLVRTVAAGDVSFLPSRDASVAMWTEI